MRLAPNDQPVASWSGRLFGAATLVFVAVFVIFVVGLIAADARYVDGPALEQVWRSGFIRDALWLSLWTSTVTTAIALVFAIPMGYALSRYRFPGRMLVDTIVDLPIVFPPLVAGLTLLVFFHQTTVGKWIQSPEGLGIEFAFTQSGIVLCMFFVAASYAIRSVKAAFDSIDRRLEHVALTLGCTQAGSFFRVALPLARSGILAGAVLTWARAFGIFGPLLVFVGSFRGRTEVLSTTIYLEQSIGNLEVALAVALLLIGVALLALLLIRLLGGHALLRL